MVLAGLLGAASMAGAADDSKKPAPKAPSGGGSHASAAANAHVAGGGGTHGATTGGGGSHGSTAGGTESHGITNNGGGSHTFNNGGAHANDGGITHGNSTITSHTTTTTTHTTTTTTGMHSTVGSGGGFHPGEGTGSGSHVGEGVGAGSHTFGGQGGGFHAGGPGAGSRGDGGISHSAFHSGSAPRGANEHLTRSGSAFRTRPNGGVSDVHDVHRGMDIHHGLAGGHSVLMERHDGSRIFAERGRPGYVERGYHYGGHDFARRAYFYNGHSYNRFYVGYGYHGVFMHVYAPGFYYHPAFYGWAYNPWVAPISYGWGWRGSPWYGHYGYYFQPYPVYTSAAFWLTDYIISQNLQAAYAAHQEAGEAEPAPYQASGGQPVLTPEVKQMIADEVKAQLALENQEAQQNAQGAAPDPASSGIARLLSDGHPHVFVAGGSLDVTDASGNECVVSDGDALQLQQAPPSDATAANLVVLSSKGRPECQISLTVQVQLTDLQEMQNHMRETIDQGLQDLESKQGTNGLPAAPPSAQGDPAPAAYAAAAPPPEANVAADVQGADQQAAAAEKDVTAEAAQDGGGAANAASAGPATVELGQTTEQVQGALGMPSKVANLGSKVIYYYDGMKVTFKDGRVSDVE
jgi:hypothetical protein